MDGININRLSNEGNIFNNLDYNDLLEIDAGRTIFYYFGKGLGIATKFIYNNIEEITKPNIRVITLK